MARTSFRVTEGDIRRYEEDGVVCLRGVLDQAWVDLLRDELERVLASPGPQGKDYEKQGSGRFRYDTFMWTRHEPFWRLQADSPLPGIMAAVMRSTHAYLMADIVFAKEPNTPNVTPWHQDQPYGWYDGKQVCSAWTPLDEVDSTSGAMEYVLGSHRWGKWYRPVGFDDGKEQSNQNFEHMPDIEAQRISLKIAQFDCVPGDVLVHHSLVLHGSPGNSRNDRRRRALSFRYAGDDATYADRPVGPKPVWNAGLEPGQHFGCDLFPQVWPPASVPRFWERSKGT